MIPGFCSSSYFIRVNDVTTLGEFGDYTDFKYMKQVLSQFVKYCYNYGQRYSLMADQNRLQHSLQDATLHIPCSTPWLLDAFLMERAL